MSLGSARQLITTKHAKDRTVRLFAYATHSD